MTRPLPAAVLAALALTAPALAGGGAAETAEYELLFDATWSAESHPRDFPSGAHFSPLIGGTHTGAIAFWEEGAIASEGIERMAELGSKSVLREEVNDQIAEGNAGRVVEGNITVFSPGRTFITFEISRDFPRVTVVSMIAPSPDWFVGTQGLVLFDEDHWIPEVVFELLPYDAGTDSGVTYSSSNDDTQPPEPIAEIIGYPFAEDGEQAPPLGTFTFKRLDAPPCPGDVNASGKVDFEDVLRVLQDWGPCEGCPADRNDDGVVDFEDVLVVLDGWGPCG